MSDTAEGFIDPVPKRFLLPQGAARRVIHEACFLPKGKVPLVPTASEMAYFFAREYDGVYLKPANKSGQRTIDFKALRTYAMSGFNGANLTSLIRFSAMLHPIRDEPLDVHEAANRYAHQHSIAPTEIGMLGLKLFMDDARKESEIARIKHATDNGVEYTQTLSDMALYGYA